MDYYEETSSDDADEPDLSFVVPDNLSDQDDDADDPDEIDGGALAKHPTSGDAALDDIRTLGFYMPAARCGRESHIHDRCFANTSSIDEALPESPDRQGIAALVRQEKISSGPILDRMRAERQRIFMTGGGVYVLRLHGADRRGDRYYVGKAADVARRVAAHQRGSVDCAMWVKRNNGVAAVEEPYTPRGDDLGAWEMRETIDRMIRHGIDNVRGWEWTRSGPLTRDDYISIRLVACGVLDCCRACGQRGHFVKDCSGDRAIEPWMQRCEYALRAADSSTDSSTGCCLC